MSAIHPMPSLKSSVGSKSSNLPLAGRGGGGDGSSFSFYRSEQAGALRSSWISRLLLRPLPPPPGPAAQPPSPAPAVHSSCTTGSAGGIPGNKRTVSTDESRASTSITYLNSNSAFVARRYLSLLPRNPDPPTPLPWVGSDGGETHPATGFGPFQVRTGRARPQRPDGNCDRRLPLLPQRRGPDDRTELRLPPFFQFRPQLIDDYLGDSRAGARAGPVGEGNAEFTGNDPTSSWNPNHSMPAHDENKRAPSLTPYLIQRESIHDSTSRYLSVDPLPAGPSVQHVARSRGASYHESIDESSARRNFSGLYSLHHSTIPHHPEIQTPKCLNETEQPFSYWNMGRLKRTNTVSSVSPAIALARDLGRKRKLNTDVFTSSKSKKLGSED